MKLRNLVRTLLIPVLVILCAPRTQADELSAAWLQVVRDTPYVFSAGLYSNLSTIRRWVLLGEGYCAQSDRHVLFDQRGRFLTWLENAGELAETQRRLNAVRETLYRENRVHRWVSGNDEATGYPFALSCDQPHVDMAGALGRLLGTDPADRVWGTWDGMVAGSIDEPIPLIELVLQVFREKAGRRGYRTPERVVRAFLGQIIIESGVRKHSFSSAQAVGLLQLRPEVLEDCELAERFRLHRMAQVDCAVRLYQQIDRNLRPLFDVRFGHLPEDKRDALYSLLLVQAYHSGIGRMEQLLGEGDPGAAARTLAADHARFSAEDLALGIIFHNMGRIGLGLSSLYYLVDVAIAGEALCATAPPACR